MSKLSRRNINNLWWWTQHFLSLFFFLCCICLWKPVVCYKWSARDELERKKLGALPGRQRINIELHECKHTCFGQLRIFNHTVFYLFRTSQVAKYIPRKSNNSRQKAKRTGRQNSDQKVYSNAVQNYLFLEW